MPIKRIMSVFFCDRVPAVTDGKRSKKAAFILKTLKDMGAETAHLDAVGNVVYPYQLEKPRKTPSLHSSYGYGL